LYAFLASLEIMRRRGLIRPRRLGANLRTLRVARRAGPFAAMIAETAHEDPGALAVVAEHGTLTYGELEGRANALAHGLTAAGVAAGDVAGFLCRDDCGLLVALIAAGKLGVRAVLLNTGLGRPQLRDAIEREQVTTLFLDSEFLPLTDALPAAVRRTLTDADNDSGGVPTLGDLIAGRPADPPPLPARPGGMVLFTSGTTGNPRGAPRGRMSPTQSAQLLHRIPLSRGGTLVLGTPLFHGTGLGQVIVAMTLGKTIVLRRRFDAEVMLRDLAGHRADTLVVVPTLLHRLLELGPRTVAEHDTSALRVIVSGGSALAPDLYRRATEAFGDVLYNVYGSTETGNASVATPAELRRAPGTVGRAPVGCRLALYDEHRRRVTEPGRRGTIFARNGLSFAGYTDGGHKEIVDGLVCTGDIGHFDRDGLLFVDGRDDEMIVSGGENVFPVEVEHLLIQRPDVRDAAVVAVEDADFGKRLRAFIVPAPGAALDPAEIQQYVKANLARYKVPRDVVFLTDLPRNATGKLLRRDLDRLES
jgi:fatty-acyl-CoA synthase